MPLPYDDSYVRKLDQPVACARAPAMSQLHSGGMPSALFQFMSRSPHPTPRSPYSPHTCSLRQRQARVKALPHNRKRLGCLHPPVVALVAVATDRIARAHRQQEELERAAAALVPLIILRV